MTDTDDIEQIRAEKRERLERELGDGEGASGEATGTPDTPRSAE
jgi:hypothetical protein